MRDISGANAIVTGASRGLGVQIARRLASEGAHLALAARSAEPLEALRAELLASGVKVVAVPTDVTVASQREDLVQRATDELGSVEILVNNAGLEIMGPYPDLPPARIEEVLAVNLTAAMLLTHAVLPGMQKQGRGHVVNIASGAGKSGIPYGVPYSASKFGLVGATHALRAEYYGSPIGFSVVCPGFVRDEGMYARFEQEGVHAPLVTGTTSPAKVAEAVIDAIKHDRLEVMVNDVPLRPLVVLASALPQLAAPVMKYTGMTDLFRRAGEIQSERH